jgi:hypothetical protein
MYADIFNCQVGLFPIKYFGVPISASRLHTVDWIKLEGKLEKKLDIWQGNFLSIAGKLGRHNPYQGRLVIIKIFTGCHY